MKHLSAPLLALVATLVTDTVVAAGIDTQSSALFESMVNVTNPSAHMGQRRGAFAAGSVVTRNRLMNESLWHFVPPSFEAGCGGIDMFAGSFSFISAEQFQQLLRSIAANATGYAFEVALTAMCPTCVEVMESLQRKLQALNQGYANSCQLAKGLVNDVASAFDIQHKDNTSLVAMAKGLGDVFETRSTATGESPIAQVRDHLSEEERAEADLQGNLVWQALKRQGAAGWFVGGDDALLEAIMSVTGSVILGPPEPAPDGAGENFGVTLLPGNVMTVRDLLWGSSAHEDNSSGQSTAAHVIKRYRCDTTTANGCTAPTVLTDTETVGLVQHTKNLLLGDPTVSGSVGLVQKFRLGAEAASAPEQAFMELAPNGLGAQLRNLARHDEGLARIFARQAAPVIALEMAQLILSDLLRAAEHALALERRAYTTQVVSQIQSAREQVYREYEVLAKRYGNVQTLLAYYQDLTDQVKGRPESTQDRP